MSEKNDELYLEELTPLDLREIHTVGELVDAMRFCSFGARMLGETAATLTQKIRAHNPPLLIYDYERKGLLSALLKNMENNGWFSEMMFSDEFAKKNPSTDCVVVVGDFNPRYAKHFSTAPKTIFINESRRTNPQQIRDGYFPDAVFCDPNFIMPVLAATLHERMNGYPATISKFFKELSRYDGIAPRIIDGAETLRCMIADPDCTVFLTMSGAMTIAKMGLLICDIIDEGWVQAVSTTGALMAHGLTESIGLKHYKYDPAFSDAFLAERKLNRVTDTLEPESNLDRVEEIVANVLERWSPDTPISSFLLNARIGAYLAKHFPEERGILKSAYERNVPVFIPAFSDSEIGNDTYIHFLKRVECGLRPLCYDHEQDTSRLIRIATKAKKTGIFTIGGGVPRNWIQNVFPLIEIINDRTGRNYPMRKLSYGCRINPDPMDLGHLSGCTYSEGMSWRKMDTHGQFSHIPTDATLVLPFLIKYLLEQEIG